MFKVLMHAIRTWTFRRPALKAHTNQSRFGYQCEQVGMFFLMLAAVRAIDTDDKITETRLIEVFNTGADLTLDAEKEA